MTLVHGALDDYIEDSYSTPNSVAFFETRVDQSGDAQLKIHKRFSTVQENPSLQIGVDTGVHNRFITISAWWQNFTDFKADIEMIFVTMRKHPPLKLYVHDFDGELVYNGTNVMCKNWSANFDHSNGAEYNVRGKIEFAFAAYFVVGVPDNG